MLYIVKKTLKTVVDSGNDIVVQVKKNQEGLYYDCERAINREPIDTYEEPFKRCHNRLEQRTVRVFDDFHFIGSDVTDWEKYIKCIVEVRRIRRTFDTKKKEYKVSDNISYYISTRLFKAKDICEIIRNHWFIENKNHYVKDVSMNEDKSRIRVNANIFMRLRSFALNIMRVNNSNNIKREIFRNCMSLDKVLNYKGIRKE